MQNEGNFSPRRKEFIYKDRKFSSTFFKRWRRQGRGALVALRRGRNILVLQNGGVPPTFWKE